MKYFLNSCKNNIKVVLFFIIISLILSSIFFQFVKTMNKRLVKVETNTSRTYLDSICRSFNDYESCFRTEFTKIKNNRKNIVKRISSSVKYIEYTDINIFIEVHPNEIGLGNDLKKNYNSRFHKYFKLLGINTFIKNYTYPVMVKAHNKEKYTFIVGSLNCINIFYLYFCLPFSLLLIALLSLLNLKRYKNNDLSIVNFRYQKSLNYTFIIFILLICLGIILIKSKSAIGPYHDYEYYDWVKEKMNFYKIHELLYFMFSSLIFIIIFIFFQKKKVEKN